MIRKWVGHRACVSFSHFDQNKVFLIEKSECQEPMLELGHDQSILEVRAKDIRGSEQRE